MKWQSYEKSSGMQKESLLFFLHFRDQVTSLASASCLLFGKSSPRTVFFLSIGLVRSIKKTIFALNYNLLLLFIMAVIKCPHCGHSISNKAPRCIYCGAPVVKMQKCADCGFEYPESAQACPSCGCPTSRKAKAYSSSQEEFVDAFMLDKRDLFPVDKYTEIRSWLMTLNLRQLDLLEHINYRDTTIMLILAILVGYWGIDRFLLKDYKMGALKLVMVLSSFLVIPGLVAIFLWVMDCIKINELTKEYNYNEMRRVVAVM